MQISRGAVRVQCDNEMAERLEEHREKCGVCQLHKTLSCFEFETILDFHLLIMTTRHEIETENN